MRRGYRLLILLILFVCLTGFFFSDSPVLAQTYPEIVRIGLYFGNSQASNISFNSKEGLEIGYYKDSKFNGILSESGNKQAIIRKDAYFIKNETGLTEYNPNEGVPFAGETLGPFHIQIGDKLSDYKSALNYAGEVKKAGILAYPVFDDGWAVWTGFYGNEIDAQNSIPNLKSKVGTAALKVIVPTGKRFIVYNSDFEPRLIFGSENLRLVVRPNNTNNPQVLSVNGKQYRGEIECRRFADSDMTVINVINIEQYLYGVIPGEIGYTSPMESLKAQAVAARTYTYLSMGKYKKWDFDLVNTVDSQVYGGYDVEKSTTNQAVNETKGKKVLYNGKLASLFYSSSSGGMTEDNINVWGTDIPYLKSVSDPYESGTSYNYNCSRTLTSADVKMKLFLSDVEIGDIISMTAESYTEAGRVNKLKITGTLDSIIYHKEDIRKILGDNGSYLPSRMFTINSGNSGQATETVSVLSADGKTNADVYGAKVVTSSGTTSIQQNDGPLKILGASSSYIVTGAVPSDTWVLTGKGWGHAVGMSQEGAKGFAKNGYTYDQILKHYFTGVTVE